MIDLLSVDPCFQTTRNAGGVLPRQRLSTNPLPTTKLALKRGSGTPAVIPGRVTRYSARTPLAAPPTNDRVKPHSFRLTEGKAASNSLSVKSSFAPANRLTYSAFTYLSLAVQHATNIQIASGRSVA